MAQNAPPSIDVPDIQFKLHDKFQVFEESNFTKNYVNLLDTSAKTGLLFTASPLKAELKVFKLQEITNRKYDDLPNINTRIVPLASCPQVLSCNNDGSMLAIHYMLNSSGLLQIMQCESFLTQNLVTLYSLPISPELNVFALQLLWNPVMPNNMAIIASDGSATIFNFNNAGQYDMVSLSHEYRVKCGCWSPKGKQIVLGFADGKLQQFKPNLSPARSLQCPTNIHPGPFDVLAVHWLSTYQFAAIFLQRDRCASPYLYIINAPKNTNPNYVNYYDICYSSPGPRAQQITFIHVAAWNLLLVCSANGVEMGILGTIQKNGGEQQQSETPTWIQYNLLDEARIELPLTESKDETYPMGITLDTSCTHQLIIKESQMPIMPMIHAISTHGQLISFVFINLSTGINGICSPPPPLVDKSNGQFQPLQLMTTSTTTTTMTTMNNVQENNLPTNNNNNNIKPPTDSQNSTFVMNSQIMTSTPAAKEKPLPLFGNVNNLPKSSNIVDSSQMTPTIFNNNAPPPIKPPMTTMMNTFSNFPTPNPIPATTTTNTTAITTTKVDDGNNPNNQNQKALYTIPSTFVPPKTFQPTTNSIQGAGTGTGLGTGLGLGSMPPSSTTPIINQTSTTNNNQISSLSNDEEDLIVKHIIAVQTDALENELQHNRNLSNQVMDNLGNPEEMKACTNSLHDLEEIVKQAYGDGLQQDIQNLRHSLNETYVMFSECRSKLELFNNPDLYRLTTTANANPANRRQISKLKGYINGNEAYLQQLQQLLDIQWSEHQDVVRRNSQYQMHIPCLDGIYQKMSQLKDMMTEQRHRITTIKQRLKQGGFYTKLLQQQQQLQQQHNLSDVGNQSSNNNNSNLQTKFSKMIDSLSDSMTTMNLKGMMMIPLQMEGKLSEEKLRAIQDFTGQQKTVNVIRPQRPDRIGLKSEVILETKLQNEQKQKEKQKMQQENAMKLNQEEWRRQEKTHVQQQQQMKMMGNHQNTNNNIINSTKTTTNPTTTTTKNVSLPKMNSIPTSFNFAQNLRNSMNPMNSMNSNHPNYSNLTNPPPPSSSSSSLTTITPMSLQTNKIGQNQNFENNCNNNSSSSSMMMMIGNNQIGNSGIPMGNGNSVFDGRKAVVGGEQFLSNKPQLLTLPSTTTTTTKVATLAPTVATTTTTSSIGNESTFVFGNGSKSVLQFGQMATNTQQQQQQPTTLSTTTTTTTKAATLALPPPTTTTVATTPTSLMKGTVFGSGSGTAVPGTTTTTTFNFGTAATSSSPSLPSSTTNTIKGGEGGGGGTFNFGQISDNKSNVGDSNYCKEKLGTDSTFFNTDSFLSSLNICTATTKGSTMNNEGGGAGSGAGTGAMTNTKAAPPVVNIFSGLANQNTTITPFSFNSSETVKPFATTTITTTTTTTTNNINNNNPVNKNGMMMGMMNVSPSVTITPISQVSSNNLTLTPTTTTITTTPLTNTTNTSGVGVGGGGIFQTSPSATNTFSFGEGKEFNSASSLFGAMNLMPATTTTTTGTGTGTGAGQGIGQGTTPNEMMPISPASSPVPASQGATATAATTTTLIPTPQGTPNALAVKSMPTSSPSSSTMNPIGAQNNLLKADDLSLGGRGGGGVEGGVGGGGTASNQPPNPVNIFAAAVAASPPPPTAPTAPAPGPTSPFQVIGGGSNNNNNNTGANIFAGVPKPEAANNNSPFGMNNANTNANANAGIGGSIFSGSNVTGFNFQKSNTSFPTATSNLFSGKATNIFAAPATTTTTTMTTTNNNVQSGDNLFAKGSFSSPPGTASGSGSLFGGAGDNNNSFQTSLRFSSFAQPGAVMGGGGTAASGNSLFGGGGGGGIGGSFSFGGGGAAAQQPVFGGPPAFGSPPSAFGGAQPTFGGAPTFTSPKGFTSFAATNSPPPPSGGAAAAAIAPNAASAFGGGGGSVLPTAATSGGNIFETLGSSSSGAMSFGNLAESTPPTQNKPASTFGGSSFMNYRS